MALGSRPSSMPMTTTVSPSTGSSSMSPRPGLGPGHVVGPVENHQRSGSHHLHPTGVVTDAQACSTTSGASGARRRFGGGRGDRPVLGLVGSVERQIHLGILGRRCPQVDQPAPTATRLVAVEIGAPHPGTLSARPSAASAKTARSPGSISPTRTRQPGLMMPAFSMAMSRRVGPRTSTWS